jgi:hypothetical protein
VRGEIREAIVVGGDLVDHGIREAFYTVIESAPDCAGVAPTMQASMDQGAAFGDSLQDAKVGGIV